MNTPQYTARCFSKDGRDHAWWANFSKHCCDTTSDTGLNMHAWRDAQAALLAPYNARFCPSDTPSNFCTGAVEFNSESDFTMFLLRYS